MFLGYVKVHFTGSHYLKIHPDYPAIGDIVKAKTKNSQMGTNLHDMNFEITAIRANPRMVEMKLTTKKNAKFIANYIVPVDPDGTNEEEE